MLLKKKTTAKLGHYRQNFLLLLLMWMFGSVCIYLD